MLQRPRYRSADQRSQAVRECGGKLRHWLLGWSAKYDSPAVHDLPGLVFMIGRIGVHVDLRKLCAMRFEMC